ncbi:hypothetical protein PGB90_003047 [Kerria lacca]
MCHKEHESMNKTTHNINRNGNVHIKSRTMKRSSPGRSHTSMERLKSRHSHRSSCCSSRGMNSECSKSEHKSRRISTSSHCSKMSMCRISVVTKKSERRNSKHCYDQPKRMKRMPCKMPPIWQNRKYIRNECGEGIVPKRMGFKCNQKLWCTTPLTMYQATIGEMGKKLLCQEIKIPRDVKPQPPCNISECILPSCHGYYRKYDCIRSCEEDHTYYKQGKKIYRNRIERYWEPCLQKHQRHDVDVNTYAGHNVALAIKLRRCDEQRMPCW